MFFFKLTTLVRDFQDLSCTERKPRSVQFDAKIRRQIGRCPVGYKKFYFVRRNCKIQTNCFNNSP